MKFELSCFFPGKIKVSKGRSIKQFSVILRVQSPIRKNRHQYNNFKQKDFNTEFITLNLLLRLLQELGKQKKGL